MLVPFSLPTVGPTNQREAEAFKQMSQKLHEVSSAIGWAISLGKELRDGQQFDDDRLERVRSKLPGVEPRLCTAYTTALFVVEKVCLYYCMLRSYVHSVTHDTTNLQLLEEAGQIDLKEEAEDFLGEILPLIGPSCSSNTQSEPTSADVSTVCQNLEAVADWAASLKNEGHMHEVSHAILHHSDSEHGFISSMHNAGAADYAHWYHVPGKVCSRCLF